MKPMSGKSSASHNPPSRNPSIKIYPDPAALTLAATDHIVAICNSALERKGWCSLVLSGGSTPKAIYALLRQDEVGAGLDWERIQVFWGDERAVPPDHPDSNYRMAWEALLSQVPIPKANIHRMHGEIDPTEAASDYEWEIRRVFHAERRKTPVVFDLVLLGMGEDGHVASLFPGSSALAESERWVAAVEHTLPPPPTVTRISLTLPIINSAQRVMFIVAGKDKAKSLRQIIEDPEAKRSLPAGLVEPKHGMLLWLLDGGAASLLNKSW